MRGRSPVLAVSPPPRFLSSSFCPLVSLVLLKSDPFLSTTRASFPSLLLLSFFRFIVVVVAQKTGSGSIRSISH